MSTRERGGLLFARKGKITHQEELYEGLIQRGVNLKIRDGILCHRSSNGSWATHGSRLKLEKKSGGCRSRWPSNLHALFLLSSFVGSLEGRGETGEGVSVKGSAASWKFNNRLESFLIHLRPHKWHKVSECYSYGLRLTSIWLLQSLRSLGKTMEKTKCGLHMNTMIAERSFQRLQRS